MAVSLSELLKPQNIIPVIERMRKGWEQRSIGGHAIHEAGGFTLCGKDLLSPELGIGKLYYPYRPVDCRACLAVLADREIQKIAGG